MAGRRVLIATGGTSGLGHEALFQLLSSPTPSSATWRVHLGARSTFDTSTLPRRDANKVTSSPLDLASFDSVRRFVQSVKEVLEDEGEGAGVDCLLLNAAVWKEGRVPGEGGWSEECTVNHFAQHYLVALLEPYLSKRTTEGRFPRIIFVSSTKHTSVPSLESLIPLLRSPSIDPLVPSRGGERYSATKFVSLVSAHEWKARLQGLAEVISVSPGFVPTSRLGRDAPWFVRLLMYYVLSLAPFASTMELGGAGIARSITMSSDAIDSLVKNDDDEVLLLNNLGGKGRVDPRILEGGDPLRTTWCPPIEQLESW